MLTQVDYDEWCIYNIIPRTTAKRAIQRDILKVLQINQKEILKMIKVETNAQGVASVNALNILRNAEQPTQQSVIRPLKNREYIAWHGLKSVFK